MKTTKTLRRQWFSSAWFSSFSANILGVIIGIALTFGITYLIQQHQEKKQMREMVTLLKRELANNKEWLSLRAQNWKDDFNAYWTVLDSTKWKTIPPDTLEKHITYLRSYPGSTTTSYIWNVMQTSGMLQKLNNVELVADLSEYYFWLSDMKKWWDLYLQKKNALADVYQARFWDRPYEYFKALLANKDSRKIMEDIAIFNRYNFPEYNDNFSPLSDYLLFQLDNYDKPHKTKDIDFETFTKMKKIDDKK